jgi:hypothetical protein
MFVQLAREDFELIGKLRKMTNDRVDRVIVKISLDFIYIYIYISFQWSFYIYLCDPLITNIFKKSFDKH